MSKKRSMILGYTRTGIAVSLPTRPDPESFADWSRGDHVDASRILMEHAERELDEQAGSWCVRWANVHRTTAKPPRGARREPRVRGAAEIAILSRRRRRS